MLAIAPHKCGAIFLSTVDGSAGYAQNSPEQFLVPGQTRGVQDG